MLFTDSAVAGEAAGLAMVRNSDYMCKIIILIQILYRVL